jgi:hypothetical protein
MVCITNSGELTICKSPFATDKSDHAPRVWPVGEKTKEILTLLQTEQLEIDPDGKWLYRFDAKAEAEDRVVNLELAKLLRWATGDDTARTHSMRGTAYQNILWPGWIAMATEYLAGRKDSYECHEWIHNQSTSVRWMLPIQAMEAAGHGAVDPGFTSYASAWPLLYSIALNATLTRSQPSDLWRKYLGILPKTMPAAKGRKPKGEFDRWFQLARGIEAPASEPLWLPQHSSDEVEQPPLESRKTKTAHSASIDRIAALKFLSLLGMKEPMSRATRDSGLDSIHCTRFQKYMPSIEQIETARERKKSTSDGVALEADIELVKTDHEIVKWIASMESSTALDLKAVLYREKSLLPHGESQVRSPTFWQSLLKDIPAVICIRARFGRGRHLDLSEELQLKRFEPALVLDERHRDLGAMPELMLSSRVEPNYVESRRQTAVAKLYLLMLNSIQTYEVDCLKAASGRLNSSKT